MEHEKQTAMVVREEFGAIETSRSGETAAMAVAEQAKAAVQARYIMALQRPRNIDQSRVKLLLECSRPGFADVAIYYKPVGKGVEGPSIRFAEAALRCMTNMMPESVVVYDDQEKRILRVSVTDLEANLTYSKDIVIEKTVERSNLKAGQTALRSRTNSYGKTTYLVEATEDDLLNKQNALESKALRVLALRHLPGDILDDCMRRVEQVRSDRDAKEPAAARKAIIDAFAALNVMPASLSDYLGHDLGSASPAEMHRLRNVYAAVRDGETSWPDAVAHAKAQRDGDAGPSSVKATAAKAAKAVRERQATEASRIPGADYGEDLGPPPGPDEAA